MFKHSKLAHYVFLALAVQVLVSCSGKEEIDFFPQEVLDEMYAPFRSSSSVEQSSSSNEQGSSSSVDTSSSSSTEQSSSSGEHGSSSSALPACGEGTYNPKTQFCLNSTPTLLCGGMEYDEKQFCLENTVTEQCGGSTFYSYQFCDKDEVYDKCGTNTYNTDNFICCNDERVDKHTQGCCRNQKYTLSSHFCYNNTTILEKCGGTGDTYTPGTEQCCGRNAYNQTSQFCYNNSKIVDYCGNRTETFDPDIYGCKPDINANGIYLKNKPKDEAGKEYEAVLIGTQTWMAENLNYAKEGSKCGGSRDVNNYALSDDNTTICDTYGRLYKWSTAMDLGTHCDDYDNDCQDEILTKHQGICPTGWHIPSDNDWEILMSFAHEDNAGKYLKAVSGWSGSNGNGTDDYGFSALPGGYGTLKNGPNGLTSSVGSIGYWWSAGTSYCNDEWDTCFYYSGVYWYMRNNSDKLQTASISNQKDNVIYSVRCVMD